MNEYKPFDKSQIDFLNKCLGCWLNVSEGGKRGAKNVINALAYCIILENHKDKLHLVAGVSIASAKLNIIDSNGYGIMNYFSGRCREGKYKNKDCLYVNTYTGQKIILISGGAKDGDEKYIKGNTYGTAYITEANECHTKFINEVMDRTMTSSDRKIFHDLNPKPPAHWYYTEFLKFHEEQQKINKDYGYNYGHFNIFNNLSITNEKLKKILSTYNKNSIWYKRDILGKRIASAGVLFGDIANDKERYLKDKSTMAGIVTTGVDFGKNGSAHAFCTQVITRDFSRVQVLKSDEVDCKDNAIKVTDNLGIGETLARLEKGFIKHIKYVIIKYGMIDYIFCDNAEPELIEFLRKALERNGLHIPVMKSVKIEIPSRIHLWGVLLMQDRLSFIRGETDLIVKALQEATQDEEAEDDRYLDDGTSDIDILDGHNYGIEKWYKQLLRIGEIK